MLSEDGALALVHAKAEAIRRQRRRLAIGSGGALAAVVLTAGILALNADGDQPTSLVTADRPAPSAPAATDRDLGGPVSSPTDHGQGVTEAPDGGRGNGLAPAPDATATSTTSPAPAEKNSGTPADPMRPTVCAASSIGMTVSTDRESYRPGEPVSVRVEATNKSGHACANIDSTTTAIRSAAGGANYEGATAYARTEGDRWVAGETIRSHLTWRQETFEHGSGPPPEGVYIVTVTWVTQDPDTGARATYTATIKFEITA